MPKHNPWLIAITVSVATFMEVLDSMAFAVCSSPSAFLATNAIDRAQTELGAIKKAHSSK